MADDVTPPTLTGWQWLIYKAMQWVLPSLVAAAVAYFASLPARERAERAERMSHETKADVGKAIRYYGAK